MSEGEKIVDALNARFKEIGLDVTRLSGEHFGKLMESMVNHQGVLIVANYPGGQAISVRLPEKPWVDVLKEITDAIEQAPKKKFDENTENKNNEKKDNTDGSLV